MWYSVFGCSFVMMFVQTTNKNSIASKLSVQDFYDVHMRHAGVFTCNYLYEGLEGGGGKRRGGGGVWNSLISKNLAHYSLSLLIL